MEELVKDKNEENTINCAYSLELLAKNDKSDDKKQSHIFRDVLV